jgi:hypothetical protein
MATKMREERATKQPQYYGQNGDYQIGMMNDLSVVPHRIEAF